MDENNLLAYINSTQILFQNFNGIYSSNDIPRKLSKGFYILNTDPNYLPGKHWTCLYVKENRAYYFNSLGRKPMPMLADILQENGLVYEYSTKQVQGLLSDVCGDYCLIFAYILGSGHDLLYFISLFTSNTAENDKLIEL